MSIKEFDGFENLYGYGKPIAKSLCVQDEIDKFLTLDLSTVQEHACYVVCTWLFIHQMKSFSFIVS